MNKIIKRITVQAPPLCKYKCRYCVLANGVGGLLVEDSDANISGVGVGVRAGSYNEPEEINGLAHFAEHMLFLGTSKYPDEGSYDKFVSENGGSNNAYTLSTCTAYYCSISTDKLAEALDRISQFFISPLFTESAIDREIHAIDSEFSRTRDNESSKLASVLRAICSPKIPYHRFSTGNLATLGSGAISVGDLQSALRAFFDRYYRPDALCAAVVSSLPLDAQEELFAAHFSAVPARGEGEPGYLEDARRWAAAQGADPAAMFPLGARVLTAPPEGDDTRKLVVLWPMEPLKEKYYKAAPLHYYSHLLGHEAEGSVAHYLREKGLSLELMTSSKHNATTSILKCTITLTAEGWRRKDDVLRVLFAYASMLRKLGPQEWVFRELMNQSKVDFMFASKGTAYDFVSGIFDSLFDYPPEDVFTSTIADVWDPALVARVGATLTPGRCIVVYSAAEYADAPGMSRTPHYNAPYKVEPLDPALVAALDAAAPEEFGLHLPERNPFTPDPDVLMGACSGKSKDEGGYTPIPPEEVFRSEHSLVYFKEDRHYDTPTIKTYVSIASPLAKRSPRDVAGLKLLVILFKAACMEWDYFAELAGHGKEISVTLHNIGFVTVGYSDKHFAFVRRLISEFCSFSGVAPSAFAVGKEKYANNVAKWRASAQPTSICQIPFDFLCKGATFSIKEVTDALAEFTPESFAAWLAEFWAAGVSLLGVVFGCTSAAEARALAEDIDGIVSRKGPALTALSDFPQRVVQPGCTVLNVASLNPSNGNSCVENTYYVSESLKCPDDLAEGVRAAILVSIVEPAFYEVLRTKEQLGYVVWFYDSINGFSFLNATVQSSVYPPDYLEGRIQAFFEDYYPTLKGLSEERFEEVRRGYISSVLQPPVSMSAEAARFAAEFFKGSFLWDRKRVIAEIAKTVTKDQVVDLYERVILNKATRRMITTRVYSKAHQTPETPKLLDAYDPDRDAFAVSKDWPFVPTRPGPLSPEPTTAGLTVSGLLALLNKN